MNLNIRILSVLTALIITIQPVLPYIEYFTFKKYIAENLCINRDKPNCYCHGKCFLKKMLKENNAPTDQKMSFKSQQKPLECNLPAINYSFKKSVDYKILYLFYIETYNFNYSAELFHPPQNPIL
jgi:hypothetical protein